MDLDAILMLGQARQHRYDDWWSPIWGALWGQIDHWFAGPAPILIGQCAIYWLAVFLLARRLRPWKQVAACLAAGAWPPITAALGLLWKDTWTAACLLLLVALITESKRWRLAEFAVLFLALAARHNTLIAAAPLVFGLDRGRHWRAFFFLALTWFATERATSAIIGTHTTHPGQQFLIHDLVGLSLAEDRVLLPAGVCRMPANECLAQWREAYDPRGANSVTFENSTIALVHEASQMRALQAAWLGAVVRHPLRYLDQRWALFATLVDLQSATRKKLFDGIYPNLLGLLFEPLPLHRYSVRYTNGFLNTPIFALWPYLTLSLLGAVFIRRRAPKMVALSGALYLCADFVIAPSPLFRYGLWSIVALWAAVVLLLSPPRDGD